MRLFAAFIVLTVIGGCTTSVRSQGMLPPVDTSNLSAGPVTYTDSNGTSLQGYVAYDNRTQEQRPAVVIVPALEGVGDYAKWRAQLLANMGYVGFVSDIYSAQYPQPIQNSTLSRQLIGQYNNNPPLFRERMLAAIDQVKKYPQVDADSIAAIGYCFGGSGMLQLARAWPDPRTRGLKGVMAFHPGALTSPDGSNLTEGVPIYISVQHGFNDRSNTQEDVMDLMDELDAANATWEFTDYGRTVHSFTTPTLPELTVVHGANAAYSPYSDLRSWWALRGFLLQAFGRLNATDAPYTGEDFDYASAFVPSA